jgi:hypothetical protein
MQRNTNLFFVVPDDVAIEFSPSSKAAAFSHIAVALPHMVRLGDSLSIAARFAAVTRFADDLAVLQCRLAMHRVWNDVIVMKQAGLQKRAAALATPVRAF